MPPHFGHLFNGYFLQAGEPWLSCSTPRTRYCFLINFALAKSWTWVQKNTIIDTAVVISEFNGHLDIAFRQ